MIIRIVMTAMIIISDPRCPLRNAGKRAEREDLPPPVVCPLLRRRVHRHPSHHRRRHPVVQVRDSLEQTAKKGHVIRAFQNFFSAKKTGFLSFFYPDI